MRQLEVRISSTHIRLAEDGTALTGSSKGPVLGTPTAQIMVTSLFLELHICPTMERKLPSVAWPWARLHETRCSYSPLYEEQDSGSTLQTPSEISLSKNRSRLWLPVSTFLVLIFIAITYVAQRHDSVDGAARDGFAFPILHCSHVRTRREWRTLSKAEKSEYIDAVKCMTQTPSKMGLNGTLYDDFPWTHAQAGGSSKYPLPRSNV